MSSGPHPCQVGMHCFSWRYAGQRCYRCGEPPKRQESQAPPVDAPSEEEDTDTLDLSECEVTERMGAADYALLCDVDEETE
jgi:hypothetical protein